MLLCLLTITIKLLILAIFLGQTASLVDFTNIQYIALDKAFADFEYCYIKAVNRTYKYVSLKVKLFQVPINNVSVRVKIMKKASGWRFTGYGFLLDACKFLKQRKTNPLYSYAYGFIKDHSNMNHSCPFDHDLIVEKIDIGFIENRVTRILPVSKAEYALYTEWIAYNKLRAKVNVYVKIG